MKIEVYLLGQVAPGKTAFFPTRSLSEGFKMNLVSIQGCVTQERSPNIVNAADTSSDSAKVFCFMILKGLMAPTSSVA